MNAEILKGKKILVGITGGIAAYKIAELIRLLKKEGADVHVLMTQNAKEFITPLTLATLSQNPVSIEMFGGSIRHIELTSEADLLIVAPATANIIGKMANGIADDLLSTAFLAMRNPVLFVPSMNVRMWENPVVRENIKKLEELGYVVLEPEKGELACKEEGKGRLPSLEEILEIAKDLLTEKDFIGEKILVTAGATLEPIDPVRFISNRSSGKMGYALAKLARRRGASVTVIAGRTDVELSRRDIKLIRVETAKEMRDAVIDLYRDASIIIKAAAVADFRCKNVRENKIKKDRDLTLELERNPDILKELGERKGERVLVGFAAETENLEENALMKLKSKNLDLIVANDITNRNIGFGSDLNEVLIIFRDGRKKHVPPAHKDHVADVILDAIKEVRGNRF